MQINILCSADDKYIPYCGIMLQSLFKTNPRHTFNVYLISENISRENHQKLESMFIKHSSSLIYCSLVKSDILKKCETTIRQGNHVSLAAYYRLFVEDIVPNDVKKILYLDCDIIIMHDIAPLWLTDVSDCAAAVVNDEYYVNTDAYNRLDILKNVPYFNSGMLLINVEYWRCNRIKQKCAEYINEKHSSLKFHDQDVLNYVLHDSIKFLPLKYNFQTGFLYQKDYIGWTQQIQKEIIQTIKDSPTVLHYTGPLKPWMLFSRHPYRNAYRKIWRKSPWRRHKLISPDFISKLRTTFIHLLWKIKIVKQPMTYIINAQK